MKFDYYEPSSLQEAFSLLAREGDEAKVLAGGTDLLLQMRRRVRRYRAVVNIKGIPGLQEIGLEAGGGISIGAVTTFRALEADPMVGRHYPALVEAARVVAGVQLRNLATVGGNLGNASPSADSVPPLVALAAAATIAGSGGTRVLPVEECFLGPGRTVLTPEELFIRLSVPSSAPRSGNAYQRFTPRSAMDIAVVSVAASVELEASGHVKECRVALGAVSPVPLRARRAEEALKGQRLSEALLERAGALAAEEAQPISDIRGSAEYRRAMVAVLTRRVVALAVQRAAAA